MNTTQPRPHSPDLHNSADATRATASADRSVDRSAETSLGRDRGFLMDLFGVLPAPTLGRELFAAVVNLVLVAVLITVIQPAVLVTTVMAVVVALFLIGRLVAGFLTRDYAQTLRGGR